MTGQMRVWIFQPGDRLVAARSYDEAVAVGLLQGWIFSNELELSPRVTGPNTNFFDDRNYSVLDIIIHEDHVWFNPKSV